MIQEDNQGLEDVMHHNLGLNESATDDDLKKPIVNWLFDLTPPKKASTGFY